MTQLRTRNGKKTEEIKQNDDPTLLNLYNPKRLSAYSEKLEKIDNTK